ncbi:hypothetical protein QLG02_10200 [Aeromonas sp. V90_14]|uniref:hypothetical protein n=1 Tax=Aeromonas sp. V90_14 TaxID=3044241 RepID=UPI00249DB410|nr:hypothetical protein [Aeromonas sp. V90_14]MDI3430699.1 hypothetical protein [Aeromonas sp. V90_14]
MMAALKVMTYFKISLSTHNWDRAFFIAASTSLGTPDVGADFAQMAQRCHQTVHIPPLYPS